MYDVYKLTFAYVNVKLIICFIDRIPSNTITIMSKRAVLE